MVARDGSKYHSSDFVRSALQTPYIFETDRPSQTIKGGVNFETNKRIDYTRTSLLPHGPINTNNNVFVPENILLSLVKDFAKIPEFKDPILPPNKKIKRHVGVMTGKDNVENDRNYSFVKSTIAFPFNVISSSVSGGYQTEVQNALGLNLEITNLHNDVYGPDMEKPLQGPFSEHNVGGLQYRHAPINKGTDSADTRAEGWRILLGTCNPVYSGAIGMVGADYPHPLTSLKGTNASVSYTHLRAHET